VKALASEKLLGGLGARGISLGLDRIQSVLHQLNDPQNAVGGVVHVTGTNGKGSVSCFVEAALRGAAIAGAGGQVGLFTSPHLVRFTECIKVDGEDIPDADLVNLATVALQACREVGTELTQFEVLTVAAFLYFKRRGVGAVVLEVGLGGRLDSTNVVPAHLTLCSVVTSISLDHTNILGSTLAAIAREKSGIFRRGRPVVLGANIPHEAREVLLATAASLDCPVVTAGRAELDASGASCSYRELAKVSMPLRGDHQLVNLATAADVLLSPLVLEHVAQTSAPTAFAQGISSLVRWPARLQPLVYQQRLVLLDGSHNEAAGSVLSDFVSAEAKRLSVGWWPMDGGVGGVCGSGSLHAVGVPVHWIVGMLVGKKHAAYLQTILCADRGDTLTCVPVHPNVSWHSGAPPDVLAAAVPLTVLPSARIRVCATVEEAVASTTSVTAANQTLVVVCGSLHLCGQVLAHAEATSVKGVAPMELLETLRYCVGPLGILLMTEHLARLRDAAARFGFPFSEEVFRAHVAHAIDTSDGASDLRIRCTLAYDGAISISATALAHDAPVPCLDIPSINEMRGSDRTVSVSVRKSSAINALNPMLSYKTTWRQVYRDAMAQRPSAAATSDVLLVNSCDEVTEATIYNVMILCPDTDRWVTPPVACGLLPGVLRAHLLTSKKIVEGIVTLSALRRATAVCVMNSVRGVLPARVVWDDGV
jgi:dihydrofolate synthase/folylpolyglutamate synthase